MPLPRCLFGRPVGSSSWSFSVRDRLRGLRRQHGAAGDVSCFELFVHVDGLL